ncbi:hypothetical protein CDO25_19240 (plasmid) [Sinorhizobium meliloti]|nr:hypothetical protein CDO25_19240 [Sinorhizobium meliloti]
MRRGREEHLQEIVSGFYQRQPFAFVSQYRAVSSFFARVDLNAVDIMIQQNSQQAGCNARVFPRCVGRANV